MGLIYLIFWLAGTLVVVLGPMILIHELGHFLAAKLAGVRVEEFGVGYPPRLLKLGRSRGHLQVQNVRVTIPADFEIPSRLYVGARVAAVARQERDGTRVLEDVARLDSPDAAVLLERRQQGDRLCLTGELTDLEVGTLYSLNLLPMGAFVKMTGEEDPSDPRSLAAQPKRWRVAVLAAGPLLNIVAALLILAGAYLSGLPDAWLVRVADVEPGTAAAQAGLQAGDVIVAADGKHIQGGTVELRNIILDAPERPVKLDIVRGDSALTLTATPRRSTDGTGFLGIMMDQWPDRSSVHYYSLPQAVRLGTRDIVMVVGTMIRIPALLAEGTVTPEEVRPTSMVGITGVLTYALQQSIAWRLAFPALQTASFISLALGLTNLLPLPALDGGRILFVIIEALRGRRISPEREAVVHVVGLAILVGIMMVMMLYDVVNPIIPWSWLR